MYRFSLATTLFICCILLFSSYSRARQLILAFDISQSMASQCSRSSLNGLESAKQRARDLLDRELQRYPESKCTILTFTDKEATPLVTDSKSWADLKKALRTIAPVQTDNGSVTVALDGSLALLAGQSSNNGGPKTIILFTTSRADRGSGLLAAMTRARLQGATVQLQLFTAQENISAAVAGAGEETQALTLFSCTENSETAAYEQRLFFDVRKKTAAYLGIPVNTITMDSDLIRDLGADPYSAYELLAMLCNEYEVSLPEEEAPTEIGAIVSHLAFRTRGETVPGKSYKKIVYYATDRNTTGREDPEDFYGIQRSENNGLSYGTCLVSIPESHRSGHMEEPFLGLDFLESTEDHFVLLDITPLDKEEMFSRLAGPSAAQGQDPTADDIMIFIHGFNQSFETAAKRTAQIALDLNFKGKPFMYSWPSNDSLFDYWSDREDVIWSSGHLARLLEELHSRMPEKKLNLIAHSMGNQALINALNRLALAAKPGDQPLFTTIILAAPDFDARLFQEQIAPEVVKLADNWSIYTSENDAALTYSGSINDSKRLGVPLPVIEGMNIIDATSIEVTPWSVPEFHSYYATKLVVIRDMSDALKGIPPTLRALSPMPGKTLSWLLKIPEKLGQEPQGEWLDDTYSK